VVPAPSLVPPDGAQTVFVHLDAEPGVRLEVDTSTTPTWTSSGWQAVKAWALACEAPCDRLLPLGHEYRLADEHIRPSFELQAFPGQHVVITFAPASKEGVNNGTALVVVGSLGIAAGIGLSIVGYIMSVGAALECGGTDAPCTGGGSGYAIAGVASLTAGAGVLAIGILVLTHSRAQMKQRVTESLAKPLRRPDTAWLRAPVWRDSVRDAAAGPATVGIPIFSRGF
jgi:hypothetical protein